MKAAPLLARPCPKTWAGFRRVSAVLKLSHADLDRIAEAVAARLLCAAPSLVATTVYTTNKRGPHIPGKSRRWMLDHLSEIPGARKEGRDWVIPADAYLAWGGAEDARLLSKKKQTPAGRVPGKGLQSSGKFDPADLVARAERSLARQGYRPTR